MNQQWFTNKMDIIVIHVVKVLKSHKIACKTRGACGSLLANNGFICGVWHRPGCTLSTQQMVHIENYFKPFLVFTYSFTSLITWWTNDTILCFVATCIPVKVIFQKQSLELDPTTSKMTCDSRDLHTWARSYWRPLKCWNRPNFAMLSLKWKGTCAKIRWVKLEQLSRHGAAPALNNHSCFYDAESAVIRH